MSLFIRGDEKYAKHFPVVGVAPNIYSFNNLSGALGPYVNNIQFYDKYTGRLGPSFSPSTMLSQMVNSFQTDPRYASVYQNQIRTNVYHNDSKNFSIGLIGTSDNITITKKALDDYFNKSKTPVAPVAPVAPAGATVTTSGPTTVLPTGP
jgi:hypothetical protein